MSYIKSYVASAGAAGTISAIESSLDGSVTNGTYIIHTEARFAFDIKGIYGLEHTSGTSTLAVQINGTDVTGLDAISVTATAQDVVATGANSVAVGDQITFVITSASSATDLNSTLEIERT